MRDVLKSAFKETPDSFRNAVNNAITEAVQCDNDKRRSIDMDGRELYRAHTYNLVDK